MIKAFNRTSDIKKSYLKVSPKHHPYGFLKFPEMEAQEPTEHSVLSLRALLGDTFYEEPIYRIKSNYCILNTNILKYLC